MHAVKEAHRTLEELEGGLFGYQLGEVVAAKLSLRLTEQRLVALARLRGPAA